MFDLLAFFFALISLLSVNGSDYAPPHYVIDLSLPGFNRWENTPICADLKDQIRTVYELFLASVYGSQFRDEWLELTRYVYENELTPDLQDEMRFFGECTGFSTEQVCAANLVYAFTGYCTSIVAQDPSGAIYHGRNLDYPISDALRPSTINLNFTNGSDLLFHGMTFAGYIGIWTGFKPGLFSVSGNDRFQGSALENMESIVKGNRPIGIELRETLASTDFGSFDEIVAHLSTVPLMAPVYLIVGGTGPGEGAIITRDQAGSIKPVSLGNYPGAEWPYVVETNYDWWTPAPVSDDRRDPAIANLNALGQENLDKDTLFKIMSTEPTLNKMTTFTAIFSPSGTFVYNVTVRSDGDFESSEGIADYHHFF